MLASAGQALGCIPPFIYKTLPKLFPLGLGKVFLFLQWVCYFSMEVFSMLIIVHRDCTTVTTDRPLPSNIWDYQSCLLELWACYNSLKSADKTEVQRLTLNVDAATLFVVLEDGTRYHLPFYGNSSETLAVSYKNAVMFLLEDMGKVESADEQ